MLRIALLCVCMFFAGPAWGQSLPDVQAPSRSGETESGEPDGQSEGPDPRFDSPRSTMMTFLRSVSRYRSSEAFSEERARAEDDLAKALGLEGPEAVTAVNTAIRLHESLKRMGEVSRFSLPDAAAVRQAGRDGTPMDRFVYFPHQRDDLQELGQIEAADLVGEDLEIALTRRAGGVWTFATQTVDSSEQLFRTLGRLPPRWGEDDGELTPALRIERWVAFNLESFVPDRYLWASFAGIPAWKWGLIVVIIFAGFVADLAALALVRFVWWAGFARRGVKADPQMVRRAARPFALLAAAIVWYYGQNLLGLPRLPETIIRIGVLAILVGSVVWAAYSVVDLVGDVLSKRASRTNTKIDDLLVPLGRKTAKVVITLFGLVYVAHAMDYEVLPLLTGLGIGGLAVAFAAKDTIENFFGSIAVIADRPFEVGDWVKVDDVEGTVEELGLRSTRIRTFYDSLVTVPNATLVRAVVDNFGRRRYRRFSTHLALPYGTPPEKIEQFCEGVREIIEQHPKTRKDVYHIYLNRFGDSSLDVLVYIFHECPDWATELAERQRFMLDVLRLAEDLGVEFAFPTRTLHVLPDEEWEDVALAGRERERNARDPRRRGERDGGDVGRDDGQADDGDDGDGGEDGGR